MNTFKLRIVTVDHCMVKPNSIFDQLYSDYSDRQTSLVPTIRIFGITGEGKKGCLHVHGYYPYLSIPFDTEKYINAVAYKKKLAEELNKHLSSANTHNYRTRSSKSYNYVYKIETFKAIPFYGYHPTERTFLRIFFYNPSSVEKAKSLLDSGKVMNTVIQPYEAHIPYILKFFIDYNLYGMNYIYVKSVQYRFMDDNVYNVEKSTTCEIEGDCVAFDILNTEMTCVNGQNPGLKSMWDEERERRRNQWNSSQITPPSSPERSIHKINTKEDNYLMLLNKILSVFEPFGSDEEVENDENSHISSSPTKSYTENDFAEIFMNCLRSKEASQKTTFSQEKVVEVLSNLSQSEKAIGVQCSQSSVTSNASRKSNYSAKDFVEIFTDQATCSQNSHSSQASRASYSVDDFVKLMVNFVKEDPSTPIDSQDSKNSGTDVAETMMNCINLNGLSRISEEDDDTQITEEMSQLFTPNDKRNDAEKDDSGCQSSPLDLVTSSPASTMIANHSKFDEANVSLDHHNGNGNNRQNNEFVEVVCDCNANECCDLCCDRLSDLCDCEGGQCTKIPQIDGAFDTCYESCKKRLKSDCVNQSNTSKRTLTVPQELCGLNRVKKRAFNIPQLDGSSFEELSNKLRRPKRRPKLKYPPLPIEYWDSSSVSKDKIVNSDTKVASTSTKSELPVCNGHIVDNDRIVKRILDQDLKLSKSVNELTLQKIGRESVQIKKLTSKEINRFLKKSERNIFDSEDRRLFYKTNLTGMKKLDYLLTLCKPLEVAVEGDDKHSEESYSSDDTLVNEDLDLSVCLSPIKSREKEQSTVKLKYSIDDILQRSPKRTANDANAVASKSDLFSNCNENDFNALTQINVVNDCFLNDDESTEDYWKSDSPVKDETLSTKSSQNLDKADNLRENQENEVYTQLDVCSSQESNKSQKSDQLSVGELSDGIVSFYGYDSFSSPIASTSSEQSFLSKSPFSRKSLFTTSTQLTTIKENEMKFEKRNNTSAACVQTEKSCFSMKTKAHNYSNSIIEGVTTSQGYEFELSSVEGDVDNSHEHTYITVMSLEVFTSVSGDLKPDPKNDAIRVIFYAFHQDVPEEVGRTIILGMIIVETDLTEFEPNTDFNPKSLDTFRKHLLGSAFIKEDIIITYASDEIDMYFKLMEVMKKYDPDIILGYEIEMLSWGYLLERSITVNIQISAALSRVIDEKYISVDDEDTTSTIHTFGIKITGRIVLNLWRVLMHEITLNMYSYENVHFHVLHERVPCYTHRELNNWFNDRLNCWRTINYYLIRVEGCLRILDKLNLVEQYSELARVFGIQFYEVLSRGSQFRVESMMSRTAKAHNYIMVSTSCQQKVKMRAPEFIALTMEPESNFYTDPVVVLDFQSLYPSVIIAYNYCYSTCLGRLEHFTQDSTFEFGCYSLYTSKNTLKQHINNIHVAPNAVAFLKPEVRRGVLPQMLSEILETRIMVKNAMKANDKKEKPSKALKKLLNARQLGLKLIANVTYGYTGANFSGRMPCVEIADAIVSKGREALENAIELVNTTEKWGGRVIYGDTDSMFILFRGCSKEEAFKRGHEIADAVTAMNPKPMKLKFEKVYMPCILQSKKRYVGYSYETIDQKEPIFDAKGIETVRRDTCPLVAKILEKSLRILFTTYDTNEVKLYTQRQFQKILNDRLSNLQDFIFAREFRGIENYMPDACVPSLHIAKKLIEIDQRAEPRKHERVPYVIVCGSSDERLIKLVRQPIELIKNPSLRLNAKYYIENILVNTMNRCFNLFGVDVRQWYNDMPKKQQYQRWRTLYSKEQNLKPKTITQYFFSRHCSICGEQINERHKAAFATMDYNLCLECANNYQSSALAITEEIRDLESKFGAIVKICQRCNNSNDTQQSCCSIDCPQLFRYAQTNMDLSTVPYLHRLLEALAIRKSSLQF